ncbi:hypothetical protein N7463_000130 [Penicillium fimorum]|uniref:Uncharacterized protein n=1 Tax=Penicillium fimorum TaxID=1882269 RepID=A0A9W9Y3M3_9EURO|nr:hypothetical protein N7463_000130 [Penicillium fimorum]
MRKLLIYLKSISGLHRSIFAPKPLDAFGIHIMAPSFNTLSEQDLHEEEEEDIDFSDLKEQYEVKVEEGLDTFIVIDGLPVVPVQTREADTIPPRT